MNILKLILLILFSQILTTDYHGYLYHKEGVLSGDFIFNESKLPLDPSKFKSAQMRHPDSLNDMLIKKININLNIEYEKYIHLKITDSNNKDRWEVPSDIISNEYRYYLYKNTKDSVSSSSIYDIFFSNKSDIFSFELRKKETNEIFYTFSNDTFLFTDRFITFESILTNDNIYGFGERYHNIKLEKGIYTIWPNDTGGITEDDGKGGKNGYSHQPVAIHKTSVENIWVGFVFLNSNNQDIEIKEYNNNLISLQHKTIGGIIDYYIIVDNSPQAVIRDIQKLLGAPFLPPYWALGMHQSRYGFRNIENFSSTYNNYSKYNIPLDTMWIDIDSMDNYQAFTIDEKNFHNLTDFIIKIQTENHSHFVPIIDIGVGDKDKFSILGKKLDCFIKSNYTKENIIINVWPGDTLIPDFLNPNTTFFWQYGLKKYRNLTNYDGIWFDMNEVASLNRNAKCIGEEAEKCDKKDNFYYYDDLPYLPGYNKEISRTNMAAGTINENALLYGNNNKKYAIYNTKPILSYYQIKMTYNFLKNEKIRPFIISRSATLGTGKYCGHWLGDNHSEYKDMKNSLNGIFHFDIFGQPMTGDDICGFFGDSYKTLCNRWYNLGVFYAFSRNHNGNEIINQYPWSFNDEFTLNNIKQAINYRYSILRYIYSYLFSTSLNEKVGFFNPVFFSFPNDLESYNNIDEKAMIGDAFILFPFFSDETNSKIMKLPPGKWNYYPDGKVLKKSEEENRSVELSGEFDTIHLYMRGGFIVPWQNTFDKYIQNSYYLRDEKINLIINLDENNKANGVLFFDNDIVNTIEKKEYMRIDLNYENNNLNISTIVKDNFAYQFNDNKINMLELWGESNKQECNITIYTKNLIQLEIGPYGMIKDKVNDKFYFEMTEDVEDLKLDEILNIKFEFN